MDFGEELFDVFDSDKTEKPCSTEKTNDSRGSNAADSAASPPVSSEKLLEAVKANKRKAENIESKEDGDKENSEVKKGRMDEEDASLNEVLPRIQVHKVETVEACLHEVAFPPGAEFRPLKESTTEPAKSYPFVLDPFQKEAILCIENSESVLVSAHTSAGKTVVAEYAIAISLKAKQRVIYTTPIKALSNQKFREFSEEFVDVGLMTGDVTINPTASCLIMTTEILRSMLYRGSEVMREVAWVIFDEIHYMRDKERGVVWEETIILLPDNVHYVFLSATIPNATQFAEWICFLHKQPCHVVYTEYRPVPLQHYIFPAGADGIFMVVDEKREFREENFNNAMAKLQDAGDAAKGDMANRGRRGGTKGKSNCFKIVKMIMERNFAPVIVFSFSRKECEAHAMSMKELDFSSDREKELIEEVFKNAIDALSDEDKKLPQVELVLPLLRKGIGVHHSGLLPLLKETIEILFAEGLIKALFATETFAMGLNMPARTVVFTSARKYDGKEFRWVSSGEYIQMSGRAGRRGLDDKGVVILMIDEKMSPQACKDVIKGQADRLNSAFHLTYNMVLNLLRVEEINPEYMLERSFYQFQNYSAIPELMKNIEEAQEKYNSVKVDNEEQVSAYFNLKQQLDVMNSQLLAEYLQNPKYLLPFLQPGRLVYVVNGDDNFSWGMVVNFKKVNVSGLAKKETKIVVDVLLDLSKESADKSDPAFVKPKQSGGKGEMTVVPVTLALITRVSAVRLYFPKDLRPSSSRQLVGVQLEEVKKRFPDGLPLLDPIKDMGIKEASLKELVRKIEVFEQRILKHPLHGAKNLADLTSQYKKKDQLGDKLKALRADLKKKKSLLQMDELKCMKRVLRRMDYATPSDVIEMKGRVACEISSGDELLLTELLFNGVFNDLTSVETAALLSCLVFQEKASEMPKLNKTLSDTLRTMQDTARRIARISKDCKLEIDEDTYVDGFKPHLMEVVKEWGSGASFAKIIQITSVFEGSIIRCMRRLEELLRQMCQAAKAIGNAPLENKFADSIVKIKRDIVFAASLYL